MDRRLVQKPSLQSVLDQPTVGVPNLAKKIHRLGPKSYCRPQKNGWILFFMALPCLRNYRNFNGTKHIFFPSFVAKITNKKKTTKKELFLHNGDREPNLAKDFSIANLFFLMGEKSAG